MRTVFVLIILMFASVQCTKSTPVDDGNSKIIGVELIPRRIPMFTGSEENALYDLKIRYYDVGSDKIYLNNVKIKFTGDSQTDCLVSVSVVGKGSQDQLFGSVRNILS